jgi:uncharacterized protein (DUF427 family)
VRIEVDGVRLAESSKPTLLFDRPGSRLATTCPRRLSAWVLTPTGTESHRAYKGQAEWWSVRSGDTLHTDLAWSYRTPPESQKIAGLIAFYDEKVDVYVDGVLQERPRSRFT